MILLLHTPLMLVAIRNIIEALENMAPPALQESYDNAGLIAGSPEWNCTGIICSLDATEEVILEAKNKGCNLVVAHHPIIFSGLKKITGNNYVEKTLITAIKNDIAIYTIHTNLDNVFNGVSNKMADKLGLINRRILSTKKGQLMKLFTFVPSAHGEKVRTAIFDAGAGHIGNYSQCSFNAEGFGTFRGDENTNPFAGKPGKRHEEKETKLEIIFPSYLQKKVVNALIKSHPYEEAAYDIIALENEFQLTGSGLIGELPQALSEIDFLNLLKSAFNLKLIRHSPLLNTEVKTIALCGGAGSFLIKNAIAANAGFFVSGDIKYHDFFDADNRIIIADIGHWESEQFTIDLLFDNLSKEFTTFAVLKTEVNTNPVNYFL
ncbi:MAG: Nif3-like dinuclear metal center hexameric protein [Parafilimonas sp.]